MLGVEINWLAVPAAALASVFVGWLWYAPFLFGNLWMRGVGKSLEQVQADFHPGMIGGAFLVSCVTALLLSAFIGWIRTGGWFAGAYVGFYAGIGFVATTFAVNDIFEKRPATLWLINATHHVFVLTVMGAVIGAMG